MSAGFVVGGTLVAAGPDAAPGVGVLSLRFTALFPGCFVGVESGSGIVESKEQVVQRATVFSVSSQ